MLLTQVTWFCRDLGWFYVVLFSRTGCNSFLSQHLRSLLFPGLVAHALHALVPPPARYPDLWTLLITSASCGGLEGAEVAGGSQGWVGRWTEWVRVRFRYGWEGVYIEDFGHSGSLHPKSNPLDLEFELGLFDGTCSATAQLVPARALSWFDPWGRGLQTVRQPC